VIEIEVLADPAAVAARAADEVAARVRDADTGEAPFAFAVSGGSTPWAMFAGLATRDVPWERVSIYQVDERVAPAGDADRNLTHLRASLPPRGLDRIHAMPVDDVDLEAAVDRYGASLPERFDLIHLGLGPDGHTASLVPDDPVLRVTARDVALTERYQGHRRMTLTYPALDRALGILWLVTGPEKADALARLRSGDGSIPAGRVRAASQLLLCDRAAAG
jgi:6-phosphogluconolactonase